MLQIDMKNKIKNKILNKNIQKSGMVRSTLRKAQPICKV